MSETQHVEHNVQNHEQGHHGSKEEHGHEHHSSDLPHPSQVEHAAISSPSLLLQNANIKTPHFRDEKVEFFFKGKKDPVTKEIIPGSKRPNVELVIPVLTFDGFLELLSKDEKVQNYVLELANDAIRQGARMQVNDEDKPVNRQSELDISKLTIEYLASIPPSERGGTGISEETWADFVKDYVATMLPVTNKPEDKLMKAAKLLAAKVNPVKGEKNVLAFLQDQLGVWATNTKQLEEFGDVFKYLDQRITTLLNKDEKNILESL